MLLKVHCHEIFDTRLFRLFGHKIDFISVLHQEYWTYLKIYSGNGESQKVHWANYRWLTIQQLLTSCFLKTMGTTRWRCRCFHDIYYGAADHEKSNFTFTDRCWCCAICPQSSVAARTESSCKSGQMTWILFLLFYILILKCPGNA